MRNGNDEIFSRFALNYRDHYIMVKRDFGGGFHMIDGMPCAFGYVVTRGGCNVIPGAGWFQTVADAEIGIDCLIEAGDDAARFHQLYRATRTARTAGPDMLTALEFFAECYRGLVNGGTSYRMPEALRMADAAIAKAKGGA